MRIDLKLLQPRFDVRPGMKRSREIKTGRHIATAATTILLNVNLSFFGGTQLAESERSTHVIVL
jgi:hypothetical protein